MTVQEFYKDLEATYVKRVLSKMLGFKIDYYKDDFIMRRLRARALIRRRKTISEYLSLIAKDPMEQKKLLEALAIHVSEFFRDPYVWEIVKKDVFTPLVERKLRNSGVLKIWSAGCSKGEEPYTIVILLHEILGTRLPLLQLKIFATDIDIKALEEAKRGIYPKHALINVPNRLLQKYFTKINNELFAIKDFLKRYIIFKQHDLTKDPPIPMVDVVFLRNVMIYLSKDAQARILRNVYSALTPGGYLVLGASEVLPTELSSLFRVKNIRARIYVKL